ncbi:hypothetical protein ASE74_23405 [Pedobacter sp. Leaf216]|uniref:hypothetical protein n=1 Tax=Pedobacter sp. Leaf216 TaxID=1735684 RepID=UPI0006FF3B25|nr:hypothetical protein [Pedobacter sp. Leaf216]KQM71448.1 hypothetical protein ASE74_23405 [Pedobacter sp. Leaf216]
MGTIKYIAKTITENAGSIKWVATNGNISFNAAKEVVLKSGTKVVYGEYESIEDKSIEEDDSK